MLLCQLGTAFVALQANPRHDLGLPQRVTRFESEGKGSILFSHHVAFGFGYHCALGWSKEGSWSTTDLGVALTTVPQKQLLFIICSLLHQCPRPFLTDLNLHTIIISYFYLTFPTRNSSMVFFSSEGQESCCLFNLTNEEVGTSKLSRHLSNIGNGHKSPNTEGKFKGVKYGFQPNSSSNVDKPNV